jgi:GDPmannose 4,6-dehydratase
VHALRRDTRALALTVGAVPFAFLVLWLMLQQKKPADYVLATNETHSVREFVEECAKHTGMEIIWTGKGLKEIGRDKKTGKTIIRIDAKYYRPAEVDILLGDASKARKELHWKPKTKFKDLVKIMINADLKSEGVTKLD